MKNLIFWGMPGSGKASLINGFSKELLRYSQMDAKFQYLLSIVLDSREMTPYLPDPTFSHFDNLSTELLVFERSLKDDSKYRDKIINCHKHYLQILKDPNLFETFFTDSEDAGFLFLILDPTRVEGGNIGNKSLNSIDELLKEFGSDLINDTEEDKVEKIERSEYATVVRSMLEKYSTQNNSRNWMLAICISKYEVAGLQPQPTATLATVQELFGVSMVETLMAFQPYFANAKNPNIFPVSAYGFLDESMTRPNYDPDTGKLLDEEKWKPWNVSSPFFWAFETLEKKNLEKSAKTNVFTRTFFHQQRINAYSSYPTIQKLRDEGKK